MIRIRKKQVVGPRFDYATKQGFFESESSGNRCRSTRLVLIAVTALGWVALVVTRLYSLQVSDFERWRAWALRQHFSEVTIASERGPILDRDGKILAVSVPAGSIYVRPKQIKEPEQTAAQLAELLDMKPQRIKEKLLSSSPFVWIKRQIPRIEAQRVGDLNLPGVGQVLESRRFYPNNQAAATLIGKVGIDGNGLSGIEALYEQKLHRGQIEQTIQRDALGNSIHQVRLDADPFTLPKGGAVQLTIDSAIQMIVEEELEQGRQEANAKSAMAVMIDASNGEILSLSQAPPVNFNVDKISSKGALKNRVAETVFEPGSIMKPLVAAAAIEAGVTTASTIYDCEHGSFRFGRHMINDVHGSGELSLHDVVVRSSNIGMTKVGMQLGRERLYASLRTFGFGSQTSLGLPGESGGILRPEERWATVDIATHSFGQGVAVTPLQIVRAVGSIANGGVLPHLRLTFDGGTELGTKIMSDATAQAVKEMMFSVVEDDHGTGKRAAIDGGVRVGGKTGTAQKARRDGRGYERGAYIASFVGFVDGSEIGVGRPLTLIVVVDEPNAGSIYGGTLAAPVFQKIMKRTLYLLATRKELSSSSSSRGGNSRQPVVDDGGLVPIGYRY